MAAVATLVHDILSTMSVELSERNVFASVVRDLAALAPTPPSGPSSTSSGCSSAAPRLTTLHTRLRMLLSLARQRVSDTPFHLVSPPTLRAYTDASVLLAVLHLVHPDIGWRRTIHILDRAIIVAGALGPRRLEWVHALIRALQPPLERRGIKRRRSYRGPSARGTSSSPSSPSLRSADTPLFAPSPIPSHAPATPPPLGSPPFILRRYLSSGTSHPPWPALSRWGSAAYLLAATGRGRIVPVECGRAYDESGWTQRILPWERFLARAGWDVPAHDDQGPESADGSENDDGADDSAPLYLAQTSLFTQFPALERDIATPDYVWSPPPAGYKDYQGPPEPLVNVWIGPGGHEVVSPAHTDPYFNCYAQVLGRKRVWLSPPDSSPWMYAYAGDAPQPATSDPASQPPPSTSAPAAAAHTPSALAGEYMTNTSRVPLLRAEHEADFTALQPRFRDFFEHVYPRAMEAVLEPGDLLVMPPRWWHAMRGEGSGPCWSVSFWF